VFVLAKFLMLIFHSFSFPIALSHFLSTFFLIFSFPVRSNSLLFPNGCVIIVSIFSTYKIMFLLLKFVSIPSVSPALFSHPLHSLRFSNFFHTFQELSLSLILSYYHYILYFHPAHTFFIYHYYAL